MCSVRVEMCPAQTKQMKHDGVDEVHLIMTEPEGHAA